MAYRMTELSGGVRVGIMGDGSLDVEVWRKPKPPHATQSDYDDSCQEVVIPAEALDELFEYLRRA